MTTESTNSSVHTAQIARVQPDVTLQVPAEAFYLGVVRSTVVALASRADMSIEELEDLRIAISEAGAIFLDAATPGAVFDIEINLQNDGLKVVLYCSDVTPPGDLEDTLAWIALSVLVDEVKLDTTDVTMTLELTKQRGERL